MNGRFDEARMIMAERLAMSAGERLAAVARRAGTRGQAPGLRARLGGAIVTVGMAIAGRTVRDLEPAVHRHC